VNGRQQANRNSDISIVAVHGIGAHPNDTWCQKVKASECTEEGYINWLQDERMLPSSVPHSRILRYGYESQWFGDAAISNKASTVAQRLLLALKRERRVCAN